MQCSRKTTQLGKLRVVLTLHVDVCLLLGKRSDPVYQKIMKLISEQFDIKCWQDLEIYQGSRLAGSSVETCSWRITRRHAEVDARENGFPQITGSGQIASETCLASVRILREPDGAETRR